MKVWAWITLFCLVALGQSLLGMLLGFHPYLTEKGVYALGVVTCLSAAIIIAKRLGPR